MMKKKMVKRLKSGSRSAKLKLEKQKDKMDRSNFWAVTMKTALLISFYYITSIGLTFYQNWLLKELKFPLTIVLVHFIMKFVLAYICRQVFTVYTGLDRVSLGWSQMLGHVGIVALVASLDIGLSQWSFEYIDVALYTITKSTSIVFILMFALIFGLEKKHWSLIIIVLMISIGLIMFTYKSTDFVFLGFIMVLSASFLSGIRWTMSQLIMQRAKFGLGNPLDMIYHVQPLMIITLIPFAVGFEGIRTSSSVLMFRFEDFSVFLNTILLVVFGGVIAFLMEIGEFLLVSYTSSLTLSVAGIVKEVISLTLAIVFQSSNISVVNMIGLVVCMSGISLHVIRKATNVEKIEKKSKNRFRQGDSNSLPLLSDSDSTDSETEIYHTSRAPGRNYTEDVFMKDHRQWTSVRDSHMEKVYNPEPDQISLNNENCEVTDDIVNIEDGDTAIVEADILLSQLDLMSSD